MTAANPAIHVATEALRRAQEQYEAAQQTRDVLAVAARGAGLTYPTIGRLTALTASGARALVERVRAS